MSAISLRFLHKGSAVQPIVFDTRFGTDSPTTITANGGWFTFLLKPLCRQIWCDDQRPDDAGNGLTAATAKKTLPAAIAVFTNGSWTSGDQLMLAGGSLGGTYNDDALLAGGWCNFSGVSATYPTMVLCYDRADPTNTAKYGKLLGQKRPHYTVPDVNSVPSYLSGSTFPFIANAVDNGSGNFGIQGVIVDGMDVDTNAAGTTGRHDNTVYQNCQLKQLELGNNNASSARGRTIVMNVSKCSFYGAWRSLDGNTSGMFTDSSDGLICEDNVFAHCGWRMGSSRDDPTFNGGPNIFGHGSYFTAENINGTFRRNVFGDNATDGSNLRGSAASTQSVHFDESIAASATGFSSAYTENPGGSIVTYNDFVVVGGSNLWSSAANAAKGDGSRGGGFGGKNSQVGSLINNGVMFDNPLMNGGNSYVASFNNVDAAAVTSAYTLSNIHCHNYSAIAQGRYYVDPAKLTMTWVNCLLDSLASNGTAGVGTISGAGVRTWVGGDYPGAITKAQLITALGFANKAALFNAMIEYPHLPWAQVFHSIALPAFAITPAYSTVAVSVLTAALAALPAPTVVYKTALADLTISTLNFTRGTPGVALLSGVAANSTVDSADLPAGFTMNNGGLPFQTGSVTNGSNQLTSVSSLTGITKGMYVSVFIGANPAVPYGTYVVAISGSTVTMSANSTATGSATNVSFFKCGRSIHYDGSGAGAATPTFHTVETNLDDLGTHTTPFTLNIT